jgi:type II secretory pathway pseudopilin PulG
MKNSPNRLKRLAAKQAGLTLLEVILSLTIISSATVGLNMIADRFSDDTKNTVTASQMRTFGEAAKAYIKDNYAAVQAVATATTPALIDVPTLIAAGNLPTGFLATNAFRQSMCALVLEPSANRLQAMVVAEDGIVIDDLSMGNIASVIGGSGGAVYASDTAVIRGAIGGWSIPTSTFDNLVNNVSKKCDGTAGNVRLVAGHPAMALWFENGDTSSAFLARDAVPGRPELNAMNTPIHMKSVQVTGGACTTVGAIAQDGAGGILACQAGIWKSPGGASGCVLTTAHVNTLQTTGCYYGENLPGAPNPLSIFVEVMRSPNPNPISYGIQQRVSGIDDIEGDGASAGAIWLRSKNVYGNNVNSGWSSWFQVADKEVRVANGNVTLNQTFDWDRSRGFLNPGWVVEGYGVACESGQIGKAAYTIARGWQWDGRLMSCINGSWVSAAAPVATRLYMCPQYCQRWGSAPFISTQDSCNNNYDSGTQGCTYIGYSVH